jgi:transposase
MTQVENARDGFTAAAAARELGVHYQTIRLWLAKHDRGEPGGLPYTVFGQPQPGKPRIIRIHPDDLAVMRASAPTRPTSDTA